LNQLESLKEEYLKNKKEYDDLIKKMEQQDNIIKELDNERDEFQMEVDKKTERIVELEDLIKVLKDNELKSKQDYTSLRDQIDVLTSHLTEQDKEMISQSRQFSQLQSENNELMNTCQRYEEEIRNNNADVASLTKENQILNKELTDYANSKNEMDEEIKILTEKVNYLDQLVLTKDQEREQIMLSYKKLINEHEKLDVTYKYSTEENNNARVELILQGKQVDHLNQLVKEYSEQISQLKMDIQAYDNQITNLNRSLQTSDREIRQLETDKEKLIKEIVASRDLNLMMDRTKDEVQKEYIIETNGLPTIESLYDDEEVCQVIDCKLGRSLQPIARPGSLTENYDEYAFKFMGYLHEFLYGDKEASEVLNKINDLTKIYSISLNSSTKSGLIIFILTMIISVLMVSSFGLISIKKYSKYFNFIDNQSWLLIFIGYILSLIVIPITQYGEIKNYKCQLNFILI